MKDIQLDENRILSALEPKRKKANILLAIGMCGFVLPFIFVGVAQLLAQQGLLDLVPFSFCGPVVGIVFCIIYAKVHKQYESDYKQLIAKQVLQACFDEAKYFPNRGFTPQEFRDAHLIYWRGDFSYISEDLITGKHAGVEFEQSDVRITHTTGSGKNRRKVVDVDGRLTKFHCRKAIGRRILIVTDRHAASLERGLSKVEMEDMDFNKKFDVYSEDGHSVFYLLTPPFMEYLKKLCELDRNLYISFDGEYLYVLRSGKGGIFVPPSGKLDIHKEVEKSRQELNEIIKIIEILQMDDEAEERKAASMQASAGDSSWEEPYVMKQPDSKKSGIVVKSYNPVGIFIAVIFVIVMIIAFIASAMN